MSRKELAELVASRFDVSKSKADEMVTFIFDNIANKLTSGTEVTISGFGKFTVSQRAAREGRNPATGESISIKASRSAKFKPAKQLKDSLN